MKILKIIESIYLCIRFPFLYPRNRFTGLHYTNWKLCNFSKQWYSLTYDTILFRHQYENGKKVYDRIFIKSQFKDYYISLFNDRITIERNNKIVFDKPTSYFGEGKIIGLIGDKDNKIFLVTEPEFVKNQNNPWFISITHSKWLANLCKIANWLNKYPVQLLHCIPTFTELDSMESGWKKAFGIKMCKEIKAALKKYGYLKKYRINQIKEKYGSLRWYDAGAPEEVYQIIKKYETTSSHTCVVCGKPAKYISKGWICPYCEDCIGDMDYDLIED